MAPIIPNPASASISSVGQGGSGPTLAQYKAKVTTFLRENIDPDLLTEAINDAIESWWETVVLVNKLGELLGGPVNVTFAAGAERIGLVLIQDPVAVPVVTGVAGGNFAARNRYTSYTLVTPNGNETLPSPETVFNVPLNNFQRVASPAFVENAIGWNVYVGSATDRKALQNTSPIPFGTNWTESVGIMDEPRAPSPPLYNNTMEDLLEIEHLEVLTPSGVYKPWNEVDLDGSMMRRAAGSIASSSSYQPYFFTTVNHNSIEVRPALGAALTARYFYCRRLGRLKFDNQRVSLNVDISEAFVKYYALMLIKTSFEEYDGAKAWSILAEQARGNKARVLNQANNKRNRTIIPFRPR